MIAGAGLMSGTSLDGIDVAIVALDVRGGRPHFELLAFEEIAYHATLRADLLDLLPPNPGTLERTATLHRALGEAYAAAVQRVAGSRRLDFIAMHGQTVYHDGERGVTLQLGMPYFLRDRFACSVVFDFRSADCALGGHGAPLVPYVDALLLASPDEDRVAVNLGGIANLTYLRTGAQPADAIAFDSGPANMLIDAFVAQRTSGAQSCDRDGALAARGSPSDAALEAMLSDSYFALPPPKSTGRERFGTQFLAEHAGALAALSDADGAATLTALTARSLARAIREVAPATARVLLSGGGARNPALVAAIASALPGFTVETTDALNVPAEAKEAIAFALLGFETLRGRPANLPRVTGARSAAVLGAIVPHELPALLAKVAAE